MIDYHKHDFVDRTEVLKKVFRTPEYEKVKFYICKTCAFVRKETLTLLPKDQYFKFRKHE